MLFRSVSGRDLGVAGSAQLKANRLGVSLEFLTWHRGRSVREREVVHRTRGDDVDVGVRNLEAGNDQPDSLAGERRLLRFRDDMTHPVQVAGELGCAVLWCQNDFPPSNPLG